MSGDRHNVHAEIDYVTAALGVFRVITVPLAALFTIFGIANFIRLPAPSNYYLSAHDAGLVILFVALKRTEHVWLPRGRANTLLAIFIPLAVLSNTLVSARIGATSVPSLYVALILVAIGSIYLHLPWAIGAMAVCLMAWFPVALELSTSSAELAESVVVLLTAAGQGFLLHYVGRSHTRRLAQLSTNDAERRTQLELALAENERARADLDERVAARTTELAAARDKLVVELAERAASEEERVALERRLAEVQRTEAVGRLAGGIAHDFNNQLMVISANVDFTLEDARLEPDEREALVEVQRSVERASRLIRQLMALGRRQVMQTRASTLTELVAGVRPMIASVLGGDIALVVDVETPDPITIDVGQLEQVVMNLVLNARDAMPSGGTLTLRSRTCSVEDPSEHGQVDGVAGLHVVLDVIDTGVGMDKATRRAAFEPFFTTKPSHRGSGLGLAAVSGIVGQHRGFVEATSELGKGSTFSIFLPGSVSVEADSLVPTPSSRRRATGHETVLVVEDEPQVLRLATQGLGRLGYRVMTASNAVAALALLETAVDSVDLVLTDVVMPQIDGVKLAEKIRARWPTIGVMFMSGFAGDRLTARGLAPDEVLLEKPFTLRELGERIRAFLDARPPR